MRSRFDELLPERREARRLLIGTFVVAIGIGMTLPFLFIYLTRVRHLDPTVVGAVVAWSALLGLFLAGPAGTLIDRFGPRRVMLPLYVVEAVGVGSFGFDHHAWQAFGSATLAAVGQAVLFGASTTLMSTVTGDHERQRVFGLNFALLNLGIGAGGVAAGFIADVHSADSFVVLYLVNAAAALAPGAVLLSLPGIGLRPSRPADQQADSGGYRAVFAHRAFRRFLIFGLLVTVSGYAQFEVGLPAFASFVGHVSPRVIAFALAANTVTIVLTQMLVIRRMDGRSRSRGLVVVGLVIALAWTVLGVGGWLRHESPGWAVAGVIVCAATFACAETVMSPVMPAVTNALAPDELRGRYNAMTGMIWGITGVIGPLTAAPLIGHGLGAVWIVLIVVGALASSAVAMSLGRLLSPDQDGRSVPSGPASPSEPVVAGS